MPWQPESEERASEEAWTSLAAGLCQPPLSLGEAGALGGPQLTQGARLLSLQVPLSRGFSLGM